MRNILQFTILIVLLSSCYSYVPTTNYGYVPYNSQNTFFEDNRMFIFDSSDNVYVSMTYISREENEIKFNITIDNQSHDTIKFNPNSIYAFAYTNDSTLSSESFYQPQNVDSVISKLEKRVDRLHRNQMISGGLSLLFGLAHASAQIASSNSDNYQEKEELRQDHAATQASMQYNRTERWTEIDKLKYEIEILKNTALFTTEIPPCEHITGDIRIKLPKSPQYRFYIPMGNKTMRFPYQLIQ